jgi:putative resolvase
MVIVDDPEVDDDLVRDMTELMTSLCARLCRRRSATHRPARAIEAVTVEVGAGGGSNG